MIQLELHQALARPVILQVLEAAHLLAMKVMMVVNTASAVARMITV
jgi:hypothetical protein